MATEKYNFTGADGKRHQLKRLMDCPAKDVKALIRALPELGVLDGKEDGNAQDLIPILDISEQALRAAFIGTDKAYDKAVEEMTLEEQFALFTGWLSDEAEVNPKKD